jgi:hypothetical protein
LIEVVDMVKSCLADQLALGLDGKGDAVLRRVGGSLLKPRLPLGKRGEYDRSFPSQGSNLGILKKLDESHEIRTLDRAEHHALVPQ